MAHGPLVYFIPMDVSMVTTAFSIVKMDQRHLTFLSKTVLQIVRELRMDSSF